MADHPPLPVMDLEWEDWDPSKGNFVHHMIAGSVAGIAEHTVVYPIDTVKTHVQCMRTCPERGKAATARLRTGAQVMEMVRGQGLLRLWRGVGTMFSGCVPAHALYFSVLEACKESFGANNPGHTPVAAAMAGGVATIFHDGIMTPMDVIKQRLQLGYYRGIGDCAREIAAREGFGAFYRSFPTTLFMNIPYGCIMVAANESFRQLLSPDPEQRSVATYLVSGCGAGVIAAACTNPLDVIKTRLQTQALHAGMTGTGSLGGGAGGGGTSGSAASTSGPGSGPNGSPFIQRFSGRPHATAFGLHSAASRQCAEVCGEVPRVVLQYAGMTDAAKQIWKAEGGAGFFRGLIPRLLVHAPSVAISWTTYETMKDLLAKSGGS
jgi:solute carrier family 25 iron transporter 28/37